MKFFCPKQTQRLFFEFFFQGFFEKGTKQDPIQFFLICSIQMSKNFIHLFFIRNEPYFLSILLLDLKTKQSTKKIKVNNYTKKCNRSIGSIPME